MSDWSQVKFQTIVGLSLGLIFGPEIFQTKMFLEQKYFQAQNWKQFAVAIEDNCKCSVKKMTRLAFFMRKFNVNANSIQTLPVR